MNSYHLLNKEAARGDQTVKLIEAFANRARHGISENRLLATDALQGGVNKLVAAAGTGVLPPASFRLTHMGIGEPNFTMAEDFASTFRRGANDYGRGSGASSVVAELLKKLRSGIDAKPPGAGLVPGLNPRV